MAKIFNTIKVALADDHILLSDALALLINTFEYCDVIFTANNGTEVIDKIKRIGEPDIMIMDLNMPVMDGHDASLWLQRERPNVRVLMLTMYDTELALLRQLQAGVRGFLKKDANPEELQLAIRSVMETGYYYQDQVSGKMIDLLRQPAKEFLGKYVLDYKETKFIKLCCEELTYKQIAETMNLNPSTIDSLRNDLFSRLNVKSRIGIAMVALRHGLIRF